MVLYKLYLFDDDNVIIVYVIMKGYVINYDFFQYLEIKVFK